ncbi:MAG: hypothetical protein WBR26_15040 [Candidatus Acidiferrum sp.]
MNLMIRLSVWVYRSLLLVYPHELRARFGADMTEVFEDLLCEAAQQGGPRQIVALWNTVLVELAAVAIPARLTPHVVIAGGLSVVVSSLITWVFLHAVG